MNTFSNKLLIEEAGACLHNSTSNEEDVDLLLGDGPDGVDDAGEVAEEGEDEADPELNLPDIENARVISSRHNTNKPEHSGMHAMRAQREDEEPTS